MDLSIIVPVYNEQDSLQLLVRRRGAGARSLGLFLGIGAGG